MKSIITYSENPDPRSVAEEIALAFSNVKPVAVLFFASARYDPAGISTAIKEKFPSATVIGCSTSGELISGKMLKNSVVAMSLEADLISGFEAGVIDLQDLNTVEKTLSNLAEKSGSDMRSLSPDAYVGMILIDGMSGAEERLMDRIGDLVTIPVLGGSAGDDCAFKKTWVYLDGSVYTNAAVLALIKPARPFDLIKTQSFVRTGKLLTPTAVDEASRKVLEFNGKPATVAYAEVLGIPVTDIESAFMSHPVGLIAGDEPYVRSPQRIEGNSIYFYCQILKGVDLEILQSTDMIADTRAALAQVERKGEIKALINFNCILRTLQLYQEKKEDAYGSVFMNIPTIGFSTYGEEYIGHINQTATMLVFH